MRYILFLYAMLISSIAVSADDYNFEFINKEYDPDIATVTLEFNGSPVGFPVMRLGSSDYLVLKFDDLSNTEKHLYYRIIHCNKDWTLSDMRELDYLNGFNDERIRNYDYSSNTRVQYLHYWQKFPNKDTNFKISGNYLLVIYEDDIKSPLLTRRFIVSEQSVGIDINNIYPSDVANIRYKQEISVSVNTENIRINNPLEEVTVVALQNEDWYTEKTAKANIYGNNVLKFNKLGTFEWWGNAEFREFDIRSFFRVGRGVKFIERKKNSTDIVLETTEPRVNKNHIAIFDFNGRFFIENWDQLGGVSILDFNNNIQTNEIEQTINKLAGNLSQSTLISLSENKPEDRNIYSDYANITLYLDCDYNLESDQGIYILGAFNDWIPSEAYRMEYDPGRDMYVVHLFLKQGYYNYYYAIVDDKGNVDIPAMEGSWNETENDYQVIVYYKSLGDLYDRVVGFRGYNTNAKTKMY
jgi:hypothetical protein